MHRKASGLRNNISSAYVFRSGVLFFLIGILGWMLAFFWGRSLRPEAFFTKEVHQMLHFQIPDAEVSLAPSREDIEGLLSRQIFDTFRIPQGMPLRSLLGEEVVVASFEGGDMIMGFEIRSKLELEDWLNGFLVEGESFEKYEFADGQVWIPDFAPMGFGFAKKWVFLSTNGALLRQQFGEGEKLEESEDYRQVFMDLPKGDLAFYTNLNAFLSDQADQPFYQGQKPIFTALGESFPAFGVSGEREEGAWAFHSKMLAHEGIFFRDEVMRSTSDLIPQLASFVPPDGLFFVTGHDLPKKYQHTKQFLTKLEPQFGLLFEGLLRAQSEGLFGEDFDLEQDFLSQMHGQYAFWVDQDPVRGLKLAFLTGFGGADKEQALSQLLEALRYAQGQFVPTTQTIELPDGSIREELVSVPPENIPIRTVETDHGVYYTLGAEASQHRLSFGFLDGYFVFSTDREVLQEIAHVLSGGQSSLSENSDFRESVLLRYGPSESYGFVNVSKWDTFWAPTGTGGMSSSWIGEFFSTLRQDTRNISFSRRVYPGEIFFEATVFGSGE